MSDFCRLVVSLPVVFVYGSLCGVVGCCGGLLFALCVGACGAALCLPWRGVISCYGFGVADYWLIWFVGMFGMGWWFCG